MAKVGYGELSGRGEREMRDTAVRLERRLPGLFDSIAKNGEKIDVVSSGQGRAVDSGDRFADAEPALRPLIGPTRTDKDLLYFHKAAGGAAYRDYIENDQRLAATLKGITGQPATDRAARRVLERLFRPAFVQRIEAVYNLYAIAPAMSEESPGGRGWGMDRFVSAKDAAWFGYLGDAEEIIPLAALLDLPGSTKPAAPGQPYTYANNPWRGASRPASSTP